MPAETILRTFGVYWVRSVASVHYADLMQQTGQGFGDFVKNLDHMHQRIRATFPGFKPPSFRVLDVSDQTIQMDYYSSREGLLPFVEGLLDGLAQHFNVTLSVSHVPDASHPLPCKRMLVEWSRNASL